ncbi:MAG: ShlB/FhaC/HecB family hemolysin secretion/activation protein [Alphaproteobacteria bacterium]|nr:hypothetical protein [Alphaproteobacteria bacterium]MDE2336371.1 ShlB/FhaC/HecB family hemolysin secretion/activation protein [Alphaproteobacteria bacterium]
MKKNFLNFILPVVLASCLITSPASAVTIPGSAEPSRVQQQIAPQEAPQMNAPPIRGAEQPAPAVAPQGAEKYSFTLRHVLVSGVTVYKSADILPLFAAERGKAVTLAYVYGLAERLTAKYRNDGYILTQVVVPPQTIKNGIVHLRAVEGFVDKVSIQDAGGGDAFLYKMAAPVTSERPLNMKTLARVLLLMNDLPGVSARAVLSAAPKTQGASDVTILVSHKRADVSLEADNRGTRYLGPLQMNATAQVNAPTGHFDSIALQVARTPDNAEMTYAGVTYTVPLGASGAQLSLGGNSGRDLPGYSLGTFDINGLSQGLFAQVSYPFIRERWKNLSALLRFDYLDSTYTENLVSFTTADRLSVLRLGATWQSADRFSGLSTLTAQASRGLGLFNPTTPGTPNMSRVDGRSDFTKVTAQASRLQRVTDKVQLYAAVSGQKSADILLASEEFGIGGAAFGSAYDPSEITGEDGVAGRIELRYSAAAGKPGMKTCQPYIFYDIGKVWDPDSTAASDRIASLADAGAGVRATFTDTLSGSFEAALPLTRTVAATHNRHARAFFSLAAKF